jgi:crotonobetainyl-CoA:carnitine CoA-transferase CaiB-like acyl-CoA transferase
VYTIEEALASAPVKALGLLTQAGLLPPVRLSTGSLPAPDLAPTLGEHTEALLLELGYDQPAVSALRKQGVI